jgi:site-specific DNA-methyltransferase (adenine-specific)
VQRAKSAAEAYRVIIDEVETQFKRKLAEQNILANMPHKLIKGDLFDEIERLPTNTVDVIFCDPPYGIEADKMKRTVKHHYTDSMEYAIACCKHIISAGFTLCKPRALMFMFCDIRHFVTLTTYCKQQGWVPWDTPIIWSKGVGGHAPWGRAGFMRTYETILFATKGQKELYNPGGPDVIEINRVRRNERIHAAEKPIELLRHLLHLSTIIGDVVLDPCCGSGSIFEAATLQRVRAIGIEADDMYYAKAAARIQDLMEGKTPGSDLEELLNEDLEEEEEEETSPT